MQCSQKLISFIQSALCSLIRGLQFKRYKKSFHVKSSCVGKKNYSNVKSFNTFFSSVLSFVFLVSTERYTNADLKICLYRRLHMIFTVNLFKKNLQLKDVC